MSAHVIRLRGFWAVAEVGPGRVRHTRSVGRPRLPDAAETVWLVGERAPGDGQALVNGRPVGAVSGGQPFAVEITSLLQPRNEIAIEVTAAADAPLGEVTIEIRPV